MKKILDFGILGKANVDVNLHASDTGKTVIVGTNIKTDKGYTLQKVYRKATVAERVLIDSGKMGKPTKATRTDTPTFTEYDL